MSQHPILMYEEPPGEGGKKGREGAGRVGRTSELLPPTWGKRIRRRRRDGHRHAGKDICAARPPVPSRYLFAQTRRGESGPHAQPELIWEQFLTRMFLNIIFAQWKVSFVGITKVKYGVGAVSDVP